MIDAINAAFGIAASAFLWLNAWSLYRARAVAGVHWLYVAFFTLFGLWNLLLYSKLELWYSLIAGVSGVSANAIWLILAFTYRKGTK